MDPTIVVALIGAVATITAALIGAKQGKQKGRAEGKEEGRKHSMLKFMDVQEEQLERAFAASEKQDDEQLVAIATAMVDNVGTWRKIQENFQAMLNGRIDDLGGTLRRTPPDVEAVRSVMAAYREGFRARRLAIETELKKSKI